MSILEQGADYLQNYHLQDETIVTFLSTTCVEDFISNKNEIPNYGNSMYYNFLCFQK